MGCGNTCPFYPGKRYEDWVLEDPAGKGVDAVRPIRDEIRRRVENLISIPVPSSTAMTAASATRYQMNTVMRCLATNRSNQAIDA
jgi:hypothetical protein